MAYYLGRDLDIALTTENVSFGLVVEENSGDVGVEQIVLKDFAAADGTSDFSTGDSLFAGPKLQKNSNSVFGTQTYDAISSATASNRPDNMTGVDISLSTMDEDVQFIGQRNILKAEIKKENSVTLTRKKKDNVWNVCFNEARFGINEDGDGLADGRQQPDYTGYGFRVYLRFATGTSGETFILPNCCITDYTTSMSPDASQEESITLMSYVDPIILDGADTTEQVADAFGGL
tara:strand:+ start:196 stop:894 length:699 start_codon:yes stop_codon:yes gene_type:complete